MLAQLDANQAERQLERVHWREIEPGQHIGQRADVILVTMGNKDAANAVQFIVQIGGVGDDQVDAKHLLIGKHQSRVDDDDIFAVLDGHHVLANLAQAT